MSALFHANMTSSEARMALYAAADRMSRGEWNKLRREEYEPIADAIDKRESELVRQGWMLSE